jgi:hypothetical protein
MLFDKPAEALEPLATRTLEPSGSHRRQFTDVEPTEVIVGAARWQRVDGIGDGERLFVLQLACSFLPGRATRIEWARFRVTLRGEPAGMTPPIAVDLYPREVHEALESELSLVLEPKVSFGPADFALGKVARTIQKAKQIPVTVAAGLQSSVLYWQLEQTDGHPISGPRGFYALVSSPPDASAIMLESGVVADIVTPHGIFRAATHEHRDVKAPVQRVCDDGKAGIVASETRVSRNSR